MFHLVPYLAVEENVKLALPNGSDRAGTELLKNWPDEPFNAHWAN